MGTLEQERVAADKFNRADDVDKFLGEIADEARKGARFVPFLGSGLSAASGIPTSQNFAVYFCECLKRALGISDREPEDPHHWTWDPLSKARNCEMPSDTGDLWGALRGRMEECPQAQKASADVSAFLERLGKVMPGAEDREVFTWQIGLECLARLFNAREMMGALDESIIDSFCEQLIGTRQPNFGHMMLAHLADALRIPTILTTNFDTLIEQAFARLRVPLTAFDVHRNAGLPSARLVLQKRSLVKLNGGRYGLRADQSVNDPVQPPDDNTIAEYFPAERRTHLLVLGTTYAEKRTTTFLQAILRNRPDLNVFWMCFHPDHVAEVASALDIASDRLHLVVHHDAGLLLLHLYQMLFHSLPPAGADYPSFWRIPPYPYAKVKPLVAAQAADNPAEGSALLEEHARDAMKKLEDTITAREKAPRSSRLVIVDGERGVSSVCAAVWDRLVRCRHCVWLELDDFMSTGDALICLMNELAHQVGLPAPGPFHAAPTWEQCRDEISRCMAAAQKPCVIFLNGRDGPGHSAGWRAPDIAGIARGYQPSSAWGSDDVAAFWQALRRVFAPQGGGARPDWLKDVTVVVMVRTPASPTTARRDSGSTAACTPDDGLPLVCPSSTTPDVAIPVSIPFEPETVLDDTLGWTAQQAACICHTNDERPPTGDLEPDDPDWKTLLRFVYAVTLFRHSRHSSALFTWGLIKARKRLSVGNDNDAWRAKHVSQWMKELQRLGLTRAKPGGFAWMHRDLRNRLRERLETAEPRLKGLRAECHQGIGDWYAKLFRSSNDPQAALESLYHRLCCIEFADSLSDDESCGDPEHVKETACIEAISTLKLAQSRIVSCGYFTASSNLIQQIELATSRMRSERASQLCQMCRETLRDFAREAADFKTAARFNDRLERGLVPEAAGKAASATLFPVELRRLERQYYDGVILTGLRSYDRAKAEFHDLFRQLGFPYTWREECHWSDLPPLDIRQMGRDWARSQKGNADALKLAIRSCRRYMFLQMLIGQVHQYAAEMQLRKDAQAGTTPRELWRARNEPACLEPRRYSERIYILGTEVMRYVDDHEFLQVENAYVRTLYGVLLATLGRCDEAHRRLNEAAAYLAHSPKRNDAVTDAVLLLRRAETYLCQAEDAVVWPFADIAGPRPTGSDSLRLAYIEDAHSCLVRARERMQVGQRKDAWWWTLLYELQIKTCTLASEVCEGRTQDRLSFCKECHNRSHARNVLAEAEPLTSGDPFRLARLAILYKDLMCHPHTASETDARERISNACDRLAGAKRVRGSEEYSRYPLDGRVALNIDDVLDMLNGGQRRS